jgi:hypothetical protein|tara:strand:+ start:9490 stop:9726 length:237 start_codon:yes stop_codon:yes gene_type:complete
MFDKRQKAIQDSWTKRQLATFIYEELHTDALNHVVDTKYEALAHGISVAYAKTLTKTEMITMLDNLDFNLEPEPYKEV